MLTIDDKYKIVERFLTGKMDSRELAIFTAALEHDHEMRSILDAESGVEGLLSGSNKPVLSDVGFTSALNRAFSLTGNKKTEGGRLWLQLYAIAATLLLMVMGGYIGTHIRNVQIAAIDNVTRANKNMPSVRNGKSIMHLTKNTLLLTEEGTKSRIVKDADSSISVILSQGNACFDVANGESSPITVATPHTAIVLNKSVTRIVVTELETEVTVLDGSAEVIHRFDRDKASEIAAGSTVFADYKTIQVAENAATGVCESRKAMFRAYISWVQKQVQS